MDPRDSSPFGAGRRFPRPRGDGPSTRSSLAPYTMVSPPTRGWTPVAQWAGRPARGFPAHAGMDPKRQGLTKYEPGFPRPRGDGPLVDQAAVASEAVSPPTRGWTVSPRWVRRTIRGFPAHAGMDPGAGPSITRRPGFPRPRGDGPVAPHPQVDLRAVSPPTRGWTHLRPPLHGDQGGFPAHAGMDLGRRLPRGHERRFPRPRGDGPVSTTVPRLRSTVSPPTRGWTRLRHSVLLHDDGFPAHAGMDPSTSSAPGRSRWFPRPRGDGPCSHRVTPGSDLVSPPTRGWTRVAETVRKACGGFPAHAGMDHVREDRLVQELGFPRPRGDGPSIRGASFQFAEVSPPTRGGPLIRSSRMTTPRSGSGSGRMTSSRRSPRRSTG